MNSEKEVRKELFEPEVFLKIYRGFEPMDFKARNKFIQEEAEKVRSEFDPKNFEKELASQIGHSFLQAEEYKQAIPHFEIVLTHEDVNDPNSYYLFNLEMLIRCHSRSEHFSAAACLFDQNYSLLDKAGPFDKLNFLVEYVDFLKRSNRTFEERYAGYIEDIRSELGFGTLEGSPSEKILQMKTKNIKWNRKLGEIMLENEKTPSDALARFQAYHDSCEIEWYRNYVQEIIAKIEKKLPG